MYCAIPKTTATFNISKTFSSIPVSFQKTMCLFHSSTYCKMFYIDSLGSNCQLLNCQLPNCRLGYSLLIFVTFNFELTICVTVSP